MRALRAWLLLLLLTAGCSLPNGDRAAVEAVAEKRSRALSGKDLNLYHSLLSRDYRDKGKDFAAKSAELAEEFRAFDRIAYRPLNRRVEVRRERATITGDYALKVAIRGKTLELAGREEIRLRKEPGGWKIVGGL